LIFGLLQDGTIFFQLFALFLDQASVLLAFRVLSFTDGFRLFGTKKFVAWTSAAVVYWVGTGTKNGDASKGDPNLLRNFAYYEYSTVQYRR
jgi:hypothetical protein